MEIPQLLELLQHGGVLTFAVFMAYELRAFRADLAGLHVKILDLLSRALSQDERAAK